MMNPSFHKFVAFKHDTSFSDATIGLGNNSNCNHAVFFSLFMIVKNSKFTQKRTVGRETNETIPSSYQNKHLTLWFVKRNDVYKITLCK